MAPSWHRIVSLRRANVSFGMLVYIARHAYVGVASHRATVGISTSIQHFRLSQGIVRIGAA